MPVECGAIYQIHTSGNSAPGGSSGRYGLVVQNDALNESNLNTVVIVGLTSNPIFANLPGNVFLERDACRLPGDMVVNVSQVMSIDKQLLGRKISSLGEDHMAAVYEGLKIVIGIE